MKKYILHLCLFVFISHMKAEVIANGPYLYTIVNGYAILTNNPMYEDNRREYSGDIVIPGYVHIDKKTYQVRKIDFNAFRGNHNLETVVIENGVEEIDTLAFAQCGGLRSISFPSSLKIINEASFAGCNRLKSVVIPDSIMYIGGGAFVECDSLTDFCLPHNYSQDNLVHSYIFSQNMLTSAVMTDNMLLSVPMDVTGEYIVKEGITMIAANAFMGCHKITKIKLPSTLTTIGEQAFANCSALKSINLPESVVEVGWGAFENDSNLKEPIYNSSVFAYLPSCVSRYSIPQGIISICNSAFNETSKIKHLSFSDSIRKIPNSILETCPDLRKLKLPESVEYAWFWRTGSHKHIKCICSSHLFAYLNPSNRGCFIIPSGTKTIAEQALAGCCHLDSVTIPNSVSSIEQEAFAGCTKLRYITLGDSVSSLGYHLFSGCTNLIAICINTSTPPLIKSSEYEFLQDESADEEQTDLGLSKNTLIIIPKGSLELYRTAKEWSNFTNLKELSETYPQTL